MRKQVEEQIKHLEEMDVIKTVEGPTPWVSPFVVVPKPSGNVRLCRYAPSKQRAVQRKVSLFQLLEIHYVR